MAEKERVSYWLDIVNEDLDTAEFLFSGGRWLYTAFMCHQAIEKLLKAYWCATREDEPLYTHSHTRLLEECNLMGELSEEQLRFIAMMVPMNIEARYPSYKNHISNTLNEEACRYILEQTKDIRQWILSKL